MSGLGMIVFSDFGGPDLCMIEFLNFGGLVWVCLNFRIFGGPELDVIEFWIFGDRIWV